MSIRIIDLIIIVYIHNSSWTIQLFFAGDYEFLSTVYGLSGASGMLLITAVYCL